MLSFKWVGVSGGQIMLSFKWLGVSGGQIMLSFKWLGVSGGQVAGGQRGSNHVVLQVTEFTAGVKSCPQIILSIDPL